MEIVGAFLDEEWESLSKMFSGGENPDSLLHCDGGSLFPNNGGEIPLLAFSENSFLPSNLHTFDTNFCSISQESSETSEIERTLFPNHGDEDHRQPFLHDHMTNNSFESMSFYNMDGNNLMMPVFSDDAMEELLNSKGENQAAETGDSCKLEMQLIKRKSHEAPETQDHDQESENYSPEISPKKVPRVNSRTAQKNRTGAPQSRKNKKKIQEKNNEEEISNGRSGNRQSSSSCSSEDDSNASQEQNGGTTSESKAKTKAGRGSATDPQSLYARRRRERINERLRILQNLVPNGTKVDISTMLEEAVQYVKFLQLQIKLLSSDDLWMYAPLAYNGMDIGIYQKISPNL